VRGKLRRSCFIHPTGGQADEQDDHPAIDLAKQVFQLHGANFRGKATLRQKVRCDQLPALLAQTPPCSVVMETFASSHYWAREARSFGHKVRLIAPQSKWPAAHAEL
jgi:transposase